MTEENALSSPEPRAVSLDLELSNLSYAARGAEILADLETRSGLMDEDMEEDAPVAIMAMLALVRGRIEQVRRVIRAEENPGNIWAPHNAVGLNESQSLDVDGDVVLFPWAENREPLVIYHPGCFIADTVRRMNQRKEGEGKAGEGKGPPPEAS